MGKPVKIKPAILCRACAEKRVHTVLEWTEYHRYARHGFNEGLGWSHPDLKPREGAAESAALPHNEPR